MRVCYLTPEYPPGPAGGIGTSIAHRARGLVAAGHQVHVVGHGTDLRLDDHGVQVHLERIEYSSEHAHGRKWDKLRRTRAYQPVLTDIRTIAPTGWYGNPEHATVDKGRRMLDGIAEAIAAEATEIFRQLDAVQGGTAEIKQLRRAS